MKPILKTNKDSLQITEPYDVFLSIELSEFILDNGLSDTTHDVTLLFHDILDLEDVMLDKVIVNEYDINGGEKRKKGKG